MPKAEFGTRNKPRKDTSKSLASIPGARGPKSVNPRVNKKAQGPVVPSVNPRVNKKAQGPKLPKPKQAKGNVGAKGAMGNKLVFHGLDPMGPGGPVGKAGLDPAKIDLRKNSQVSFLRLAKNIPTHLVPDLASTYYHHPKEALTKDAGNLGSMAYGLANIPVRVAVGATKPRKSFHDLTHPSKALNTFAGAAAKDYANRYGELVKKHPNDKKLKQVIRKEGGLSYGVDAATLIPAAKGIGLAGKTLTAGSKESKLGKFFNAPRPRIKVAQGYDKRQIRDETRKAAPDVVRLTAQKAKDAHAKRKFAKARAKGKPAPVTLDANQIYPASERRASKIRKKEPARSHSVGLQVQRKIQHRVVEKPLHQATKKLNKREQAAFGYVAQGEVSATHPLPGLKRMEARILRDRQTKGLSLSKIEKQNEIHAVRDLIQHPEAFKHPALQNERPAGVLHKIEAQTLPQDVGLRGLDTTLRRHAPQGLSLGAITYDKRLKAFTTPEHAAELERLTERHMAVVKEQAKAIRAAKRTKEAARSASSKADHELARAQEAVRNIERASCTP